MANLPDPDRPLHHVFGFCPLCGTRSKNTGSIPFDCMKCGFRFHFPPTVAVGALITDPDHRLLFIERAREPGKGKLGLPGGFVDPGETAEQAVQREVLEEVGLKVKDISFLVTFPNTYHYRGIVNDVLDLFFVCRVDSFQHLTVASSEVSDWQFAHPDDSIYRRMAFESNQKAVRHYVQGQKTANRKG